MPAKQLLLVSCSPESELVRTVEEGGEWTVTHAETPELARRACEETDFSVAVVVFADGWMEQHLEVVESCARLSEYCEWIAIFPQGAMRRYEARELALNRLYDYHTHPADLTFLRRAIDHAHRMSEMRRLSASKRRPRVAAGLAKTLQDVRQEWEKAAIESALWLSGDNVTLAARELGTSRMTLYRLIAKHGITLKRPGSEEERDQVLARAVLDASTTEEASERILAQIEREQAAAGEMSAPLLGDPELAGSTAEQASEEPPARAAPEWRHVWHRLIVSDEAPGGLSSQAEAGSADPLEDDEVRRPPSAHACQRSADACLQRGGRQERDGL